jgi:hypothetical protein
MDAMRCLAIVSAFSCVVACGEPEESTEGSDGSDTGSSSGTTMPDPTADTGTSPTSVDGSSSGGDGSSTMAADETTTGPDVELQHGFVRVQLQAADGERDPFAGTARMQITLNYEQCIFDFYVANPDWRPDGPDGEGVFGSSDLGGEGWYDRLCSVDVPDIADCDVAMIEQQLDPIPVLRITYVVSGDLDGKVVPFGPLPMLALAGCSDEVLPTVRLSNGNLVVGYDDASTEIWDGGTYDPSTAATDDEAAIVVQIERMN